MKYNFDTCPDRSRSDSQKWLKYAGRDIIPAWVADMDFAAAPEIIDALAERVKHGVFGYAAQRSDTSEAIIEYQKREHNWAVNPAWIVYLPALVPALNSSIRAFCEQPSDTVLVTTPIYPPFLSAPKNSGRATQRVPMILKSGTWEFDFDALEKAVTPNTKIFLLCNPYNPLGRVFTREEILKITALCERHNLVLCSDEIHCDLVLDANAKHITTASLSPEIAQRTISLFAASKTYNVPGLSCGYAIIPNDTLRAKFKRAIAGVCHEVNIFGSIALETAYNRCEEWRRQCVDYLRGNLDLIMEEVATMKGVTIHQRPQATYLAWLDIRGLNLSDPCATFEKGGVGLSNGADFDGNGNLRLNFGCPRERLREILRRIRKVTEENFQK